MIDAGARRHTRYARGQRDVVPGRCALRRGGDSRVDVLEQTSLGGVLVLGHVARAAAARRDDGRLQSGRLEVGRSDLGRLGGSGHVARAAAAMGSEVAGHDMMVVVFGGGYRGRARK